jgi:hypothetical protein
MRFQNAEMSSLMMNVPNTAAVDRRMLCYVPRKIHIIISGKWNMSCYGLRRIINECLARISLMVQLISTHYLDMVRNWFMPQRENIGIKDQSLLPAEWSTGTLRTCY